MDDTTFELRHTPGTHPLDAVDGRHLTLAAVATAALFVSLALTTHPAVLSMVASLLTLVAIAFAVAFIQRRASTTVTRLHISRLGIHVDDDLFEHPQSVEVTRDRIRLVGHDRTLDLLTNPLSPDLRDRLTDALEAGIRTSARWDGVAPPHLESLTTREP